VVTELGDLGDRPASEALLAAAHLLTPLDQHHAELRGLRLQHPRQHDQVALLEHLQVQRQVREEHGAQRKHR
jgi:hypothetical protein